MKKLISLIRDDSFNGGESPSYDFFLCDTDRQNANS